MNHLQSNLNLFNLLKSYFLLLILYVAIRSVNLINKYCNKNVLNILIILFIHKIRNSDIDCKIKVVERFYYHLHNIQAENKTKFSLKKWIFYRKFC